MRDDDRRAAGHRLVERALSMAHSNGAHSRSSAQYAPDNARRHPPYVGAEFVEEGVRKCEEFSF